MAVLAAWFAYLYLDQHGMLRPAVLVALGIATALVVAAAAWKCFTLARRRRFRFSLRSLMVATVAFSVLLAIAVISLPRLETRLERRRAAEDAVRVIRSLDGDIVVSRPPGVAPDAPIDWIDGDYAATVTFSGVAITDEDFGRIAGLPGLVQLTFQNVTLDEQGLRHLERLPQLRTLIFENTDVSPAAVAAIQQTCPQCQIFRSREEMIQWALERQRPRDSASGD